MFRDLRAEDARKTAWQTVLSAADAPHVRTLVCSSSSWWLVVLGSCTTPSLAKEAAYGTILQSYTGIEIVSVRAWIALRPPRSPALIAGGHSNRARNRSYFSSLYALALARARIRVCAWVAHVYTYALCSIFRPLLQESVFWSAISRSPGKRPIGSQLPLSRYLHIFCYQPLCIAPCHTSRTLMSWASASMVHTDCEKRI